MSKTTPRARRVFYDRDEVSTVPDARLASSFDHTDPEIAIVAIETFDDGPTIPRWVLPSVGALALGVVLGRYLFRKFSSNESQASKAPRQPIMAVGSGFDLFTGEP